MSSTLTFINQGVLRRLEEGSFVPVRQAQTPSTQDRRDALSPLAVTKRCIRYEPLVFHHRKPLILQLANALNRLEQKILLIGGPQGSGKTSLIRGLIELMGYAENKTTEKNPQLLWFEVNRHTDFEEIIQFLLQYLTEISTDSQEKTVTQFKLDRRADQSRRGLPPGEDPLKHLNVSLQQVHEMPLLIVLDNVEYLVDSSLRLNSYPFKELLNFLLGFPNIKIMLIGERLPYADMTPNQEGILDIQLEGLDEASVTTFWKERTQTNNQPDPAVLEYGLTSDEMAALKNLYQKTQGLPWLVKAIDAIHQQTRLDFVTLYRLLNDEPNLPKALVQLATEHLSEQQRRLFQTLCFLRHPVSAKGLFAMSQVIFPMLETIHFDEASVIDLLEHSLIRPFLKISFPPQQVLNHIRNRKKTADTQKKPSAKYPPWFELYFSAKQALYQRITADEQSRIHDILQDFYLKDKSNEAEQRILRIKNRALLAEAKYHGNLVRSRTGASGRDNNIAISAQAYGYTQNRPLNAPKTLDDYRQLQLPEDARQVEPVLPDTVSSPVSLPVISFEDILTSLELSDSERALILQSNQPKPETDLSFPESQPESKIEASTIANKELDFQALTGPLLTEAPSEEDTEEKIIQTRLSAAVAAQDSYKMVQALFALAQYRANRGRYDEALSCLDKILQVQEAAGSSLLAETYQLYGRIHQATYHHNAAQTALLQAATYIEKILNNTLTSPTIWQSRLGEVYQRLGEIQAYRQQYQNAIAYFQQALTAYQAGLDETHMAEIHFQTAKLYEALQQPQQAIVHFEQSLALDQKHHNPAAMAATLANLGEHYWQFNQPEQAIQALQQSLDYDRQVNDIEGQFSTLEMLSKIFQAQENFQKASQTAEKGLTIAIRAQVPLWQAHFYTQLGQIAILQRKWPEALQHFERARSCGEQELSTDSLEWLNQVIQELRTQLT